MSYVQKYNQQFKGGVYNDSRGKGDASVEYALRSYTTEIPTRECLLQQYG